MRSFALRRQACLEDQGESELASADVCSKSAAAETSGSRATSAVTGLMALQDIWLCKGEKDLSEHLLEVFALSTCTFSEC